jgi:hypothetical protein
VPSSKGKNRDDNDKKSAGEDLTYFVNQNTGKGTWVSGDFNDDDGHDGTDIKKTNGQVTTVMGKLRRMDLQW